MNTPSNGPGGPSRDSSTQRRGGNGGEAIKQEAGHLADEVKHEGMARAEHARETAADKLDTLADGARAAASELDDDDAEQLSHYVADAAERMSELSGNLREKSVDELMRDVTRFAREQPAMFLGGSLAIGFGLARFARASGSRKQPSRSTADATTSNRATGDSPRDTQRPRSDPTGRHWPAGSASSRSGNAPTPTGQQAGFSGTTGNGNDSGPSKHGGSF